VSGDRVRVDARNCIDRVTNAETRIGAGTRVDNLCHVAHNVQTGIDHVELCDFIVLVHRAGVVEDIDTLGARGNARAAARHLTEEHHGGTPRRGTAQAGCRPRQVARPALPGRLGAAFVGAH
jgi:hypothetical protein